MGSQGRSDLGTHAYVADGSFGLHVIDITDTTLREFVGVIVVRSSDSPFCDLSGPCNLLVIGAVVVGRTFLRVKDSVSQDRRDFQGGHFVARYPGRKYVARDKLPRLPAAGI